MKPPNFFPKKTPFSQHFVIIALFPVTFFSYLKEKGDRFTKTVAHSGFQLSASSSFSRTKSIQRGIFSVLASALRSYGKRLVRRVHFGAFQPLLQKRLIIKGLRMKNHIFRRSFRQILTFFEGVFGKFSHFPKEFSTNPHIFRRSLKKVSFIEESFLGKVSSIKEISYDFSSFIKENVVTLHPD